jgi:hypothetical protein
MRRPVDPRVDAAAAGFVGNRGNAPVELVWVQRHHDRIGAAIDWHTADVEHQRNFDRLPHIGFVVDIERERGLKHGFDRCASLRHGCVAKPRL